MLLVYYWEDDNISTRWPVWLGVAPDEPEVNGTSPIPPDPDRTDLAQMLADRWNTLHPDDPQIGPGDINLQPAPEGWQNPNQLAEQAAAHANLVVVDVGEV